MKLKVTRNSIQIIPDRFSEDERDEAYIEEVLGLRQEGDSIRLVRRNAAGLSSLAYLETEKEKPC